MEIRKLDYEDYYIVKFADDCHTFFNEVKDSNSIVTLLVDGLVSSAIYDDKAVEFLKLWEGEK